MSMFTGQYESLWLVDIQQIVATGEDRQLLPVSDKGITAENYLEQAAQYRLINVNVTGQSKVTIQYMLNRPVKTGFLETLLLRPRQHNLVGNGTLRFELPANWQAVTVLTKEQNAVFPMGSMDSFYGDNPETVKNFVPAGFAVGEQKNITEIETKCGRLIYAYPPSRINANSFNAVLGKAFFEYYCTVVGPLAPHDADIVGINTEWSNSGNQPGLYQFYGQHNRTIDLGQNMPFAMYRPWEWKLCDGTPFICDLPDYAYYGFPHKLLRAWFSTGSLLFMSPGSDWFFRGGISHYFQEMAMSFAFGQQKVYERYRDMYQYYQEKYVQTGLDQSLFSQSKDEKTKHFLDYFKSGLWAFYLNQRILESTHGKKNMADLSRYLYANYAGVGRPLTYKEIEEAVNIVAGTDLSDVWSRYAYGNEPIPLAPYFQDDDHDGLMNGLEAERHTNPELADSNGDGVIDSVDYATECMQVALNPIYCNEVLPGGTKVVETPDSSKPNAVVNPSNSAINPNGNNSKPVETPGSLKPNTVVNLTGSAIKPDGTPGDWENRKPILTPPAFDVARVAGADISALYAFADSKNLYLRLDQYGGFPHPPLRSLDYSFEITSPEWGNRYYQITIPNSGSALRLLPFEGTTPLMNEQKIYSAMAIGQVLEAIVPLEMLNNPSQVTITASVQGIKKLNPATVFLKR